MILTRLRIEIRVYLLNDDRIIDVVKLHQFRPFVGCYNGIPVTNFSTCYYIRLIQRIRNREDKQSGKLRMW